MDMSRECKDEVTKDMNRMAQDYRLNWRLNHACEADIKRLCDGACNAGNGQPCGGMVLQCLQVGLVLKAGWAPAAAPCSVCCCFVLLRPPSRALSHSLQSVLLSAG